MSYYNTDVWLHDNKIFCSYCGEIIKPTTEYWGNHGRDETDFYTCLCEGAKKEIEYQKEKSVLQNKWNKELSDLMNKYNLGAMKLTIQERNNFNYNHDVKKLKEKYDRS